MSHFRTAALYCASVMLRRTARESWRHSAAAYSRSSTPSPTRTAENGFVVP
nr:hypothetical protein OH820_12700 [Streptomyces sp. NBC_00857]